MNITTLGIDLAKTVFQLHGVDSEGKVVLRKKVHRTHLMETIAKLPVCRIVMEACGGANHWAREFKKLGHEVKLINPRFVKPFLKGNKNDQEDAEAIVEAASRPKMRYVSPKSLEQQDMQSLLRARESCVEMRTKVANQLRGLLMEYGVVLGTGVNQVRKQVPLLFDRDEANGLNDTVKSLLETQYQILVLMDEKIKSYDRQVEEIARRHEICQRVKKIKGIGPLTAVALAATIGDPKDFKNGRHFSAFLGLVPRQHSSGGKSVLLGISKRGNCYLRQLLIHGARSVLTWAHQKTDSHSIYLRELEQRVGRNRATVAIANRNARIVMSLLLKDTQYKVPA